jgi:hypothetical protein
MLFTWGYWGWGGAPQEFARGVDAVEKSRGFKPPVFVDIRILRNVKAKGFCGNAFEQVVGQARYRWMDSLGNLAIKLKSGPPIQIKDPRAAKDLLDLALEMDNQNRRVIFFCACEWPGKASDARCHRVTVAGLVLKAARLRGVPVQIVEWPGGEPQVVDATLSAQDFKKLHKGAKSIPLGQKITLKEFAGLPWGSVARVRSGDNKVFVATGPAKYDVERERWFLPVLWDIDPDKKLTGLKAEARGWRKGYGLLARDGGKK